MLLMISQCHLNNTDIADAHSSHISSMCRIGCTNGKRLCLIDIYLGWAAGCEQALMPHGGLNEDMAYQSDLERHNEEVRLLYVGMTRAKQQLYLLHAQERALRGGMRRLRARISPFLKSPKGCAPSSHDMQEPPPSAAYSLRQSPYPAAPGPRQPWQTRQTTSASSEEDPHVAAPTTPAQNRAARRRR